MAKGAAPTKEELWLQKHFGVDVAKFPAETREGGKGRKSFLMCLELLQNFWEKIDFKKFEKVTVFKSGNPKFKKLQDEAVDSHRKTLVAVKKGDMDTASSCAADLIEALSGITSMLTQKDGPEPELGTRMAGTVIR